MPKKKPQKIGTFTKNRLQETGTPGVYKMYNRIYIEIPL